jgi:drug/metabolite transporter (DMT)-like permease
MSISPAKNISGAMDVSSWLTLLALAFVWGGSFFFIEIGLEQYHPLTIVGTRVGLAALFLLAFVIATKKPWPSDKRFWPMVGLMGISNNVIPFLLLVWAQTYITGGLASILNATTPIFTVLAANIMTQDERMTLPRVLAVVLGFIGVTIIIGPDVVSGFDSHLFAQIAPLGAAACYAFSTVYSRKFKALDVRPSVIATGQISVAACVLVPLSFIFDQPWKEGVPDWHVVAALVSLALFSTTLAYITYFRFIAKNGATNMALVTFLVPVSAILLGVAFLGEDLLPRHFIGMAVIGLCFIVLDGRPLTFAKQRISYIFS